VATLKHDASGSDIGFVKVVLETSSSRKEFLPGNGICLEAREVHVLRASSGHGADKEGETTLHFPPTQDKKIGGALVCNKK
jgi:hypothetical protein